MSLPRFGPAGLCEAYKRQHKNARMAVRWAASLGLTAFEWQAGHGVRITAETFARLAAEAGEAGVQLSLHAPYYISLASPEAEKRQNSVKYLLQSAEAVRALGGRRVVLHPGAVCGQARPLALELAAATLAAARAALDEAGYEDILLCPETMGKKGQLGSFDEVLALCREDKRHIPCLDIGHLNARDGGSLGGEADFAALLDRLAEALGEERGRGFYAHVSRIEYGPGGEKRHHRLADTQYGPNPAPFMRLIARRGLAPTIICESSGTQSADALRLQRMYREAREGADERT